MTNNKIGQTGVSRRFALAAAGVTLSALVVPTPAAASTQDSDGIVELHVCIDAAWNAGDATAFAAHWREDGTNISPLGVVMVGRSIIEQQVGAGLAGPMKGSRHRLDISTIYRPSPGVAVVDGDAEISNMTGPDGTLWPPLKAKFTSICTKRGDVWFVSHMRGYVFLQ